MVTLSITTNLAAPVQVPPKSSQPSPPRSARSHSDAMQDAPVDELREAISQQRRKNDNSIFIATKRYEEDYVAMTKNVEKLERNIRKMREIEGLRWLVIHNGAVGDIDAAADLARSYLSTQDGDMVDGVSALPSGASHHHEHLCHHLAGFDMPVGGGSDGALMSSKLSGFPVRRRDGYSTEDEHLLLKYKYPGCMLVIYDYYVFFMSTENSESALVPCWYDKS